MVLFDLTFDERTKGGHLDACELVYLLAFEDHIYRNGGMVALRGAINVTAFTGTDKAPGILFKITAFDDVAGAPRLAPINYAFISRGNQSFAGQELVKFDAEDGGIVVGYSLLENLPLYEVLSGGNFELNFNRAPPLVCSSRSA